MLLKNSQKRGVNMKENSCLEDKIGCEYASEVYPKIGIQICEEKECQMEFMKEFEDYAKRFGKDEYFCRLSNYSNYIKKK